MELLTAVGHLRLSLGSMPQGHPAFSGQDFPRILQPKGKGWKAEVTNQPKRVLPPTLLEQVRELPKNRICLRWSTLVSTVPVSPVLVSTFSVRSAASSVCRCGVMLMR